MNKLIVLSVLAILACAFAAPRSENETIAKKIRDVVAQHCKSELNVKHADAKILDNRDQLPVNEAQSCYIECVGRKLGLINSDGKLDHNGFTIYNQIRNADHKGAFEEAERLFQKCRPEVEKRAHEKCGAGVAIRSCVMDFFHY